MLKGLTALLLLANLAFLAWTTGHLAPWLPSLQERDREPERLRMQVRPETVVVLSPQAASAALAPPPTAAQDGDESATVAAKPPNGTSDAATAAGAGPTPIPVRPAESAGREPERRQPTR